MKRKLSTILTVCAMIASVVAMPPVQAADQPVIDLVLGQLPDWVPLDFVDALQFYNEHGKSYVADNVICLVRPMLQDKKDDYNHTVSGSMTNINTPAGNVPKIYELEIPKQPDPDDEEALTAYEEYCNKLGIATDDYSFFESYAKSEMQYVFEVQLFRVLEGYDLTVSWKEKIGDEYRKTDEFTFENPDGFTVQTDLYSWLPDCPTEYNAFLTNNGRACVYNNYIAYCADVNASTGASLKMEQSGGGAIQEVTESVCNRFDLRSLVEPVDGGSSFSVIVYQPTADGLVDVKWSVGKHWSDEPLFDWTDGSYEIKNNCSEIVDLSKGSTIITFIDIDTGELIDIPEDASFVKETIQMDYTSELYAISSNPCIIDSINAYDPHCSYSFDIRTEDGYYDFHGFEVTSETSNRIEVTCMLSCKTNPEPVLPDGATRILLYDKATGELIPNEVVKHHNFCFGTNIGIENPDVPGGWMYTGPFYTVNSNPMILENDELAHFYKYADLFEFTCEEQPEVIYYSNESMDLIFRIKIKVSGNINGDGEFSVADVVTLQKWLLGATDVEIYDWAEADYDLNNRLDASDLCIMKRQLVEKINP